MTDGNGNRVTGVIYSDGIIVLRVIDGLRWEYRANDGSLTIVPEILYLGTACTGTKYQLAPATGIYRQLTFFDQAGEAYIYSPAGALVVPSSDDSWVYPSPSGCSSPATWGSRGAEPGDGVWPIESTVKPATLVGPLTTSAQS